MADPIVALPIILSLVVALLLLVFLCLIFLRFRFRPVALRDQALQPRLTKMYNAKAEADGVREDDLAIGVYDEDGGRREVFGTRSFLGGCEF
jgi:hypothetical protein